MTIKSLNHSVYMCEYHIVFASKYRNHLYLLNGLDITYDTISNFCYAHGCDYIECNIQQDHVHLLVSIPPTVNIPNFINHLKSSIKLDETISQTRFQRGYFISTVGVSDEVIQTYIASQ